LARGEFLSEEPYEEWAVEAREEWRERCLAALSNLGECLALRGSYTEAIESCERALELDRYREDLHRRLMLYHYCAGEQALSLRIFRSYARMLESELGVAPSPELVALKERVEARDVPGVDALRRYPRPRRPLRFPYSLGRTHFAGRDAEYALLAERLREASEGAGGTVAVEGEAGIGKTRLVEEFLGYARSRGARVLSGRCYERDLGTPLEPVVEALGPLPATDGADTRGSGSEGDSRYLWKARLHEDVARVYGAFTRQLADASCDNGRGGLVLFIDDVQWADPATLDFISYLAKRISGERILLVFTYRREQAPGLSGWLEGLAERRAVSTLSLSRLSREDLAQILGPMSARAFDGLSSLASFLHRESEGNPFYAVEYLRWLIEAGAVEIDTRRRIAGLKSEALRQSVLPSGVRTLIRTRYSGLSERARELLELAAVVGRNFDLGLLGRAATSDESDVSGVIEPAISSGLISETADGEYYFSHDKLRQALYDDIGSRRRRELHLRVAGTLQRNGGEPTELAHHYLRAQEWRPALENLAASARKAEEAHAWDAASENYARALEVAGRLPDSEEKRFELLAARERLLEHMDRREERAAAVREMFELACRLGDRARIADVQVRRIGVLMALSDPEGAAEAGREALAIYRESGDRAGEARAHRELGYVRWIHQDYAGALEANLQALCIHRDLGYRQAEAGDTSNIAQVYRSMGDYDSALRWAEEGVRIDRELGDRLAESFKINAMGTIHRERGDPKTALSFHLKSLSICGELGIKNLRATQHINCGRLCLTLGDPEAALGHFRSAARLGREMGYPRDEGYALMGVGVCLERDGEPSGAAEAYRQAIQLLQTAHEDSGLPEDLLGEAEAMTLLAALLDHSLHRPM
ncbi:MAG: AAA family ATPase, partial [Actinomycetota bacterium]